jgi:hypothetical protein
MPCSCQIKLEDYPETAQWGPLFWQLLHSLSLQAGTLTNGLFQMDERRAWSRLLDALQETLPCDICRSHYGEWRIEHTVDLLTLPYNEVGPWIRRYFWDLHNKVNVDNGKSVFPWDQLATHKSVSARTMIQKLEPVLRAAMIHTAVSYSAWQTFKQHVLTLVGLY